MTAALTEPFYTTLTSINQTVCLFTCGLACMAQVGSRKNNKNNCCNNQGYGYTLMAGSDYFCLLRSQENFYPVLVDRVSTMEYNAETEHFTAFQVFRSDSTL